MTSPFKRLLRLLPLTVVAIVIVGAYILYRDDTSKDSPAAIPAAGQQKTDSPSSGRRTMPLPPVQVATALKQDIPRFLSGLGTVTAANTVIVRNRVDGQIMAIHFTEGQEVKAGDLLVEIDPRPFEVQLTQAEGQLLNAKATLTNAKRDLARYQQLVKNNLVSRQQLDAQIALVSQTEGSLKSAQGAVDSANLQLTYSRVTAPISGRVGLKLADVGNYVSSGDSTGLVVITQTHPIDVIFTLPETELSSLIPAEKADPKLTVEAWDRENKQQIATGYLLSMDNQIDVTTGTIKLKARFTNDDNRLFPNQFVNTQVKVATLTDAITIPAAAVQTGNNGSFVWLVNDENKVSKQPITTGIRSGEVMVIVQGIEAGQRVVTDGLDRLKEDSQVEIVTPQSLNSSKTDASQTRRAAK